MRPASPISPAIREIDVASILQCTLKHRLADARYNSSHKYSRPKECFDNVSNFRFPDSSDWMTDQDAFVGIGVFKKSSKRRSCVKALWPEGRSSHCPAPGWLRFNETLTDSRLQAGVKD